MIFGQILQLVVIEMTTQPHRCEHSDAPIAKPFASAVVARVFVDILGNQVKNLIASIGLTVDVLQGKQHGNALRHDNSGRGNSD